MTQPTKRVIVRRSGESKLTPLNVLNNQFVIHHQTRSHRTVRGSHGILVSRQSQTMKWPVTILINIRPLLECQLTQLCSTGTKQRHCVLPYHTSLQLTVKMCSVNILLQYNSKSLSSDGITTGNVFPLNVTQGDHTLQCNAGWPHGTI